MKGKIAILAALAMAGCVSKPWNGPEQVKVSYQGQEIPPAHLQYPDFPFDDAQEQSFFDAHWQKELQEFDKSTGGKGWRKTPGFIWETNLVDAINK